MRCQKDGTECQHQGDSEYIVWPVVLQCTVMFCRSIVFCKLVYERCSALMSSLRYAVVYWL